MQHDWPNKNRDLQVIEMIITRHIDLNDGHPLGLIEVHAEEGDKIDIKMSDWIQEIADYFHEQYGLDEGSVLMKRLLTRYFTQGETIH